MALWGKGRFTGRIDPLMHEFNQSFSYDKAMYKADITGSIAYAGALKGAGILTAEQCQVRTAIKPNRLTSRADRPGRTARGPRRMGAGHVRQQSRDR